MRIGGEKWRFGWNTTALYMLKGLGWIGKRRSKKLLVTGTGPGLGFQKE